MQSEVTATDQLQISTSQCDALRIIISRQDRDLAELRDFTDIERSCFKQLLEEQKSISDDIAQKFQLMKQQSDEMAKRITELEAAAAAKEVLFSVVCE